MGSSGLHAFLHPEEVGEKEIFISDRFKDENGEVQKFKIRPITQEENDSLIRAATTTHRDKTGAIVSTRNDTKYQRLLVVSGTVFPDFRSKELCEKYGDGDPNLVPARMLYSGEFIRLFGEIFELSGFSDGKEEEANF